jgi:hypothetical protein
MVSLQWLACGRVRPEMAQINCRNLIGLSIVAISMIFDGQVHGQSTFASLRGTVRDPSGAAIANATVTVTSDATQVSREARTGQTGTYAVFDLAPSIYKITIAAPGFATQHRRDVELTVNAEEVVDFGLNPSTVRSNIEVDSEARGIDFKSTALTEVVDARAMHELTLNGRDWTQLALLEPGVSAVRTQNELNGSNSNRGSRGYGSAVTIGGAP